jgi:hypothetical protein
MSTPNWKGAKVWMVIEISNEGCVAGAFGPFPNRSQAARYACDLDGGLLDAGLDAAWRTVIRQLIRPTTGWGYYEHRCQRRRLRQYQKAAAASNHDPAQI